MSSITSKFTSENGVPVTEEAIRACWSEFNELFPKDKDCLEELYKRIDASGISKRPCCPNTNVQEQDGGRAIKCSSCGKKTWLTAGTFFHRIKRPKAWLGAIWFIEHGLILSSSRFHKLAGIAQSSALQVFKKITMVIQSHMDEEALSIDSSCFCPVFCKRSRETPAREHPCAEQEEIEKQCVGPNGKALGDQDGPRASADCRDLVVPEDSSRDKSMDSMSIAPDPKEELSGYELDVYEALSAEPTCVDVLHGRISMSIDQLLVALTMLELAGLAKRLPGNRYISWQLQCKAAPSLQSSTTATTTKIIANCVNFIRCNFHGISRKYLQSYLAAYWCWVDEVRWRCSSVIRACLEFGPVSNRDILQYVSPALVKAASCTVGP
ncbi:MAG: hypothetical protein HY711_11775 [Candidatus Melainabacteria bacterium]|nr:hypothetical protein [Candidatus Melainabacteria bacterium]